METADAPWEGHTLLLKTGVRTDTQTDKTKVKTVYPPVSLRSLGGYNNKDTPNK